MKGGPVREEGRKVGENRRGGGGGGGDGGSGRGREPGREKREGGEMGLGPWAGLCVFKFS